MTPIFEDRRHFYSDNLAGTHPAVLLAIADANVGHSLAYGEGPLTAEAIARVCQLFGGDGVEAHFVFNGTAANVLCAAAVTAPFQAVLCSETSHIQWDECGAIERFVGCRVLALPSVGGKLTPDCLDDIAEGHAEPHQSKPRLLSITQVTEMGTLYTPEEVKALADAAHDRGWLLHMDGARLANAGSDPLWPRRLRQDPSGPSLPGFERRTGHHPGTTCPDGTAATSRRHFSLPA